MAGEQEPTAAYMFTMHQLLLLENGDTVVKREDEEFSYSKRIEKERKRNR